MVGRKWYFNVPDSCESYSVVAERFIRTLKSNIYKKWRPMIVNPNLVIWVSSLTNIIILAIVLWGKKTYWWQFSSLNEEIETSLKAPKAPKVGNKIRITKCKSIFSKGFTEN